MIPKIIHYAWTGNEMPVYIYERIENWKRRLPDWKFMLWNENNYNFHKFAFTEYNLKEKRWGYIADELRYDVVNKYGGFYLDTDMIIKKDLSPLLNNKEVWGFMYDNNILTSFFGAEPNQSFLNRILDYYADPLNEYDLKRMPSNPVITNFFIKDFGSRFVNNGSFQEPQPGFKIFPRDYFCYPSKNIEGNYAEHLFDNSWGTSQQGIKGVVKGIIRKQMPILYGDISNRRGVNHSKQFLK